MANDDGQWRAPGSGTPLRPDEAAGISSSDIAAEVARKLIVPKGPPRTATLTLGLSGYANTFGQGTPVPSFIATALNSKIIMPILAAPGVIDFIDISFAVITTGAAAGIIELFDNDTNSPLIRRFPFNASAAGTFSAQWTDDVDSVPFLNGIVAVWTPIVAAFGNSIINVNIDYRSIPIGQIGLYS